MRSVRKKKNKGKNVAYPSLLQPLPIPKQPWEHTVMDIIEGFPRSNGKDVILVVVDRFTKYGHFLPIAHLYTTPQVAQIVLDNMCKLLYVSYSIVFH